MQPQTEFTVAPRYKIKHIAHNNFKIAIEDSSIFIFAYFQDLLPFTDTGSNYKLTINHQLCIFFHIDLFRNLFSSWSYWFQKIRAML